MVVQCAEDGEEFVQEQSGYRVSGLRTVQPDSHHRVVVLDVQGLEIIDHFS